MSKTNYEEYLAEHGILTYRFVGVSMKPLLYQDRDLFTVTRKDLVKKDANGRIPNHEVVLYKRPSDGAYVLHRIVEVRDKDYVILGDNCVQREYGITDEDILGVMTSFLRKGTKVSVTDPRYRLYVALWCALEPLRKPAKKFLSAFRRAQKQLQKPEVPSEEKQNALMATGYYLVELLQSLLHQTVPPEKPAEISWDNVFALAKRHTMETMAFQAVSRLEETKAPSKELMKQWQRAKDANVSKNLVQIAERENLIQNLTENGLDILPLKGIVLIDLYPDPSWRQMADLDVLIRADQSGRVRAQMEALGYETEMYGPGKDDSYRLPPFLHVEAHRELIHPATPIPGLYDYFANPWKKAAKVSDHLYRFSWDDFYLFQMAHFYRHFQVGGCGIRNVLDVFIFLQKHAKDLHEEYLSAEFQKLGMEEFRKDIEALAAHWFGPPKAEVFGENAVNRPQKDFDYFLFSSGAYGLVSYSMDYAIQQQVEEHGNKLVAGIAYLKNLLFPSYDYMMLSYPWMKGAPRAILPLMWAFRMVHRGWTSRYKIPQVLRALKRFIRNEGRHQ